MFNKRGINAVIATLFLVILAIIAIILLWYFLKPSIVGSGQEAASAAECIKADVYPTQCTDNIPGQIEIQGDVNFPDIGSMAGAGISDGIINGFDLSTLLGGWGCVVGVDDPDTAQDEEVACLEDVTGDEVVDGHDLAFLLCNWLVTVSEYSPEDGLGCEGIDEDGDYVTDGVDSADDNPFICGLQYDISPTGSIVPDTCDDCASGIFNPIADGCDAGVFTERRAGAADVTGLSFAFTLEDGTQKVINTNFTLQETQKKIFAFNINNQLDNKKPQNVLIYPLIGKEKKICAPKSAPLSCVL